MVEKETKRVGAESSSSDKEEFKLQSEVNGEKQRRVDAGEWIPAFLTALAGSANIGVSCRAAHISRKTVYKWKEENPIVSFDGEEQPFADWLKDKEDDGLDLIEYALFKQGIAGNTKAGIPLLRMKRYPLQHEHSGPGGKPIPIAHDVISIIDDGEDDD